MKLPGLSSLGKSFGKSSKTPLGTTTGSKSLASPQDAKAALDNFKKVRQTGLDAQKSNTEILKTLKLQQMARQKGSSPAVQQKLKERLVEQKARQAELRSGR